MFYEKISVNAGSSIDSAVELLLHYRYNGKQVCLDFNGVTLYSDNVNLDDAYKAITGKTKEEHDNYIENIIEEDEKRKENHLTNEIPELAKKYMSLGRKLIVKDKWVDWDCIVPFRLHDLYKGFELESCLDIIEILNELYEDNNYADYEEKDVIERAKNLFNEQGHSGMSASLVADLVKEFSRGKEGEEFYKNTYSGGNSRGK